MKKVKSLVAWVLVFAMLFIDVEYVKAGWTLGDWKEENGDEVVTATLSGQEETASAEAMMGEEEDLPLASGKYKGMDWRIDFNGTLGILTVSGVYDENADAENEWSKYKNGWSNYKRNINGVKLCATGVTNTAGWFFDCSQLTEFDFSEFDTSNVTDMSSMFQGCTNLTKLDLSSFDTSNVTNMDSMFKGCSALKELDLSALDTSNVTNMYSMFQECSGLKELDLSALDTSNVTSMSHMFNGCLSLEKLDVHHFDTGNVTDMSHMFSGCQSLKNLDIHSFNTGNVTSMLAMFAGCYEIEQLDVSSFDTSKVTDMRNMFSLCEKIAYLDLSNFNTSNVKYMTAMFMGCYGLESVNLSSFDIRNTKAINLMFQSCKSLKSLDLSNFEVDSGCQTSGMLQYCNSLQQVKTFPDFHFGMNLPVSPMYDAEGNEYTRFPERQEKCIWLSTDPNNVPTDGSVVEPGFPAQDFCLGVYDANSHVALSDATVIVNEKSYQTDNNGRVVLSGRAQDLKSFLVTMPNYASKAIEMALSPEEENKIYLDAKLPMDIEAPSISATVPLENEVEIKGKKLKWLDMSFDIDILDEDVSKPQRMITSKIPVNFAYDENKKTIKATFGIKDVDNGEKFGLYTDAPYFKMQDICEKVATNSASQAVQDFIEKRGFVLDQGKSGVSVDVYFMGYFEYDIATRRLIESGALIGISGKGTATWRPPFGGSILYAKAELTLSAEGKLKAKLDTGKIRFEAEFNFVEKMKLGMGAGWDELSLKVEGGFEGSFSQKITIPFISMRDSLEVKLGGNLYAEGKIFGLLHKKKTWKLWDVTLWPWPSHTSSNGSIKEIGGGNFYSSEDMVMVDRNYQTEIYDLWNAAEERKDKKVSDLGESEDDFTMNDIYPGGSPQMCQLSDGTMLAVYVVDDGTKSAVNRTTLVYSVNAGNGWSEPKPVHETGRGDFAPSLTASGDKAVLVYMNAGTELADNVSVQDFLQNLDVCMAVYENGTFSAPEIVSEGGNGIMEFNADAAFAGENLAVAWIENSANDPFLINGTNSIYVSKKENGQWTRECILEAQTRIPSFDMAWIGNELYVAYTVDADNSPDTSEDAELFLRKGQKSVCVTSDYKMDASTKFVGDTLYWTSDAELMQMEVGDLNSVQATGITDIHSYKVLENKDGRAVVYLVTDGFRSELYLAKEKDGTFGAGVPITDYGNNIEEYAAVYQDNGNIAAYVYERKVTGGESVYGATDLHVSDALEAHNLVLKEAWYDMAELTEQNELPVHIMVYNGGSHAVNNINVSLEKEGNILHAESISCNVPAGEEQELVCKYTVSEGSMGGIVKVKAEAVGEAGKEDSHPDDNVKEMVFGLADVCLKSCEVVSHDGEDIITAKVVNSGYLDAADVQFQILAGGAQGEQIYAKECGNLAVGAECDITYTLPKKYLDFEKWGDARYFHVVCSTDTEEENYSNNRENVVAFPVRVAGVELSASTVEMKVNDTVRLTATVAPENALDKSVYFISDNLEVAVVLEDGTVVSNGEGIAHIRVLTADGAYMAVCQVTVKAREGETTAYALNHKILTLEAGESEQLQVMDVENQVVSSIKWFSSNESVAVVDESGLVQAKSAGKGFILAEGVFNGTGDGADEYHDVCIVQVSTKDLQSLVFEESSYELTEGNTLQITPAFYPLDTTTDKTLQWSSSDEKIASVDAEGTVTGLAGGRVTITVTAVNGVKAEYELTVNAIPRYVVTFDTGLSKDVTKVVVKKGDKFTLPEAPTREGFTFLGWYTEKNGKGTKISEATPVTYSFTLYAAWKRNDTANLDDPEPEPSEEREGLWMSAVESQIYTGTAIKPEVAVYDGNVLLTEKKDYTIAYKNTVKANDASVIKTAPTISVIGKGNYTGKQTVTFAILQKNIGDEDVDVDNMFAAVGTNTQKLVPMVTYNGQKLVNKKDFIVNYPDEMITGAYQSNGTYTIKLVGINNFTGEREVTLTFMDRSVLPKIKSISKAQISGLENVAYNGKTQTQNIVLKMDGKNLVEDTDYKLYYNNNKNTGTATVYIRGINNYSGLVKKKFKINAYDLSTDEKHLLGGIPKDIKVSFMKGGCMPEVELSFGGGRIVEGKDYTVSYSNHKTAEGISGGKKPTITIKGKGNFKGTVSIPFTIEKKDLANSASGSLVESDPAVTLIVPDVVTLSKPGKYISKPVLLDANGKKLAAGTDYEKKITYTLDDGKKLDAKSIVEAGRTITVTVIGKGNYKGMIQSTYQTREAAFGGAKVTITSQTYTGVGAELQAKDISVSLKKDILTYGTDYEIVKGSYQNNTKKGTASVMIRGIGKYGGVKTVKFKILPKQIVF